MESKPTVKEVADVISHSRISEHTEYIVRVVNAHGKLVAAGKALLADCLNEPMDISRALARLERAIAKAEGRELPNA